MSQAELILKAERVLGVGPVELSRQLRTPYDTLKDWKSGRSVMPGSAWVAIELLIAQATVCQKLTHQEQS